MQPFDSLHIDSPQAAAAARRSLCRRIFGTPHVPRELPVADLAVNSPIPALPACTRLYTLACAYSYLWVPPAFNGTLVIVHQGHMPTLNAAGVDGTIVELYSAGCAVVGCLMPEGGGVHTGLTPLAGFLRPVHATINYAFATLGTLKKVCMTGLSGGGWTTTLCAALDTRIMRSIPVAGSLPLYMDAPATPGNDRDWEQQLPGLEPYSYLDLYLLGSTFARRQTQVLHDNDECCFNASWLGTGQDYYIDCRLRSLANGGEFARSILGQTAHAYTEANRSVVYVEIAL